MSEIKRVTLSTLEPQKVNDKVNKKSCKTIRISVILSESNEDNCPEFNYKDQLAAVKKRQKQIKEPPNLENGLDPYGDDDDDVRRIALEMEAKYGTGMKKKRKGRKDDYADIGMGYDESDSFIDNTDGYDEIIPQNVTTLHGGFYINCGALEFKTDDEASSDIISSSSESEGDGKIKSSNRKRILETSDDESDSDTAGTSQVEKKPKLHSKNSMQQAIKKKLFSQNKIQVKKRRLIDPLKKTVKDLLREKREDLNMSIPEHLHTQELNDNSEKDALKENKRPMSITSVTDAIESVVKQTIQVNYDKSQNKHVNDINDKIEFSETKADVPSAEGESSQDANKSERVEVKLPENLAPDILNIINFIKQAALEYKGEGKKKFFTDEINTSFLNLERKCKTLGKSSRVKVYDHLAYFIKCRKETLIRRAKNLVQEDEERKLKKLTIKLQDSINQIMPSLMMNHEQESQRIIQKKFSKESINNEENKALKMPRKRFQWTEDTRKFIKDILSIKKRCLLLEGRQKDNLEEQIVDYIKTKIVPLWPEGWMHINSLKKVYNNMMEASKTSDNSNNINNSSKSHSSITITPVSNSKNVATNKSDVQNDITLTKIITGEVRLSSTNSLSESTKTNNSLLPPKPSPHLSSGVIKQGDRSKVEKDYDVKKSQIVQSNINHKDEEKIKHKDYDYKKLKHTTMHSVSIINETEKHRYDMNQDYKQNVKSTVIQSSNEQKNYEKDHDYRKPILDSTMCSLNTELLKSAMDTSLTGINTHKEELPVQEEKPELNSVILQPKAAHCQVIDLTEASDLSIKRDTEDKPFDLSKEASVTDLTKPSSSRDSYPESQVISSKQHELMVSPNFLYTSTPIVPSKSNGDDIQMVMEQLKALQKLSSPIKSENATGSPVSVIAYSKSFSPKSNSNHSSTGQKADSSGKNDFTGSFQEEFQKQVISSLQQLATNASSSKSSYNRCS